MGRIWSEENRFRTWLKVEIAATETLAEAKIVPNQAARAVRELVLRNAEEYRAIRSRSRRYARRQILRRSGNFRTPNSGARREDVRTPRAESGCHFFAGNSTRSPCQLSCHSCRHRLHARQD